MAKNLTNHQMLPMRLLFSHLMLGLAREFRQRGVLRVVARHVRRGCPRKDSVDFVLPAVRQLSRKAGSFEHESLLMDGLFSAS